MYTQPVETRGGSPGMIFHKAALPHVTEDFVPLPIEPTCDPYKYIARCPSWAKNDTKMGKLQEGEGGKITLPLPVLPAAPLVQCGFFVCVGGSLGFQLCLFRGHMGGHYWKRKVKNPCFIHTL